MSDETSLGYNMEGSLESEDELIFCEVLAHLLQSEITKSIGQLQARSSSSSSNNSAVYNRKKHLLALLLNASDKCELDDFRDLFETSSLLAGFVGSDNGPARASLSFLTKLTLRTLDESMSKCVDYFHYLNENSAHNIASIANANADNAASTTTNFISNHSPVSPVDEATSAPHVAEIKKEKQYMPVMRSQICAPLLNRCSFCSFKHFSKSVVQCHMAKNHLQLWRSSRHNKTPAHTASYHAPVNNAKNARLCESASIVYNNQSINLNSNDNDSNAPLFDDINADDDDDDDEAEDPSPSQLNEISM